jgi:hypothetical protein
MRRALFCLIQCLLLIACAQSLLIADRANAQSAARSVQDFGLIGKWAIECNQPPSPANEHAEFALTQLGAVWVLNDFGPDYDGMVYRVVDAQRIGLDKLSLRQVLAADDTIALDIVLLRSNDRIRVWLSRTAAGDVLVKDGMVASANRQETRWAGRCGERWAGHPDLINE